MNVLQERIKKEGKVLPGNIIKVDGFLNHRVDVKLMREMAKEFGRLFAAEISERTSASEQTVVRKAFELSKGRTGRRALVGCSLLAEGKPELLRALRAEKKRLKGLKNWCWSNA